jgi:uncharacterized protein with FMN-binding domain
MKKVITSVLVVAFFAVYAVFYHKDTDTTITTNTQQASSTTKSSSNRHYKDGTYTGSATDAYYGAIQVKATIQNGRLSDVIFLQYPHDQQESTEINEAAMPNLKQEAIQVQNANVDLVSGATQTSQAFKQSLAAALSQAK